jgi:hypothetical protein
MCGSKADATMIEIRIPVPRRVSPTLVLDDEPPHSSPLQYFVLEHHRADHRVRHPTTGRVVADDVYFRLSGADRDHVHAWLRGLAD